MQLLLEAIVTTAREALFEFVLSLCVFATQIKVAGMFRVLQLMHGIKAC